MIYIATPQEQDSNDELDRCIVALEGFLDARRIPFYSPRRFRQVHRHSTALHHLIPESSSHPMYRTLDSVNG